MEQMCFKKSELFKYRASRHRGRGTATELLIIDLDNKLLVAPSSYKQGCHCFLGAYLSCLFVCLFVFAPFKIKEFCTRFIHSSNHFRVARTAIPTLTQQNSGNLMVVFSCLPVDIEKIRMPCVIFLFHCFVFEKGTFSTVDVMYPPRLGAKRKQSS